MTIAVISLIECFVAACSREWSAKQFWDRATNLALSETEVVSAKTCFDE